MLAFTVLLACNLILLIALVRWRGLVSAEGLGLAFVTLMVVSDGVPLVLLALLRGSAAGYEIERMRAEVVPTLVHLLALGLLAVGLACADLRPLRIERRMSPQVRERLAIAGGVLVPVGLAMKVAALYLWGIRSLVDYFNNLYLYDFKVRGYAFLDQGVAIAVFGFALLAVAAEGRRAKQAAYLAAGVATAMLLSLSKSGIFSLILPFYFLARIFSPATLRAWTRAPVLLAAALLFMIGLGVKTQVKYRGLNLVSMSPETVWDIASATVEARFSSSGLYRKYSNLVNRIIDDPTRALGGEATVGVFANVIPSFVWQGVFGSEKPPHPFYARGELVNEDFHVDLYANDAPSLVGASFIDAGFLSLIPTMLFGGLFLGLLRVLWLPPDRHVVGILGYVFFASQFGPASAESGFLNVFYFLAWGVLLSVLLWIVLAVHERLMMAGTQQVLTPAAGD